MNLSNADRDALAAFVWLVDRGGRATASELAAWFRDVRGLTRGAGMRAARVLRKRGWRAVHNIVAHPMLEVCPLWGERLHDWTAERMS